jgi:uncharacterized protein (DUF488 family)
MPRDAADAPHRETAAAPPARVWTVGHSTRTLEAFLAILAAHGIGAIADVRRFPASRRHPHFAGEALAASLARAGIAYRWLPQLGGRRAARPDSPNTGWRNASFRGYADHLGTAEFAEGFAALKALASARPTAILCAEAVWWQCHRQLIADVLKAGGTEVLHIVDAAKATPHPYSGPAHVVDGRLDYAAPLGDLFG